MKQSGTMMLRNLALGVSLAGLLAIPAVQADAKVGDKAWAQCVWSQAPASASKWLTMPVPTWQSSYTEPAVLLGHRLIALCDATAADPLRPNRMPKWKSLAAALRRNQPKAEAPAASGAAAEIWVCESALEKDGTAVPFLYEVVRRAGETEVVSFQQYYADAQGQALKLPQDLRIVPENASDAKRTCRAIGPEGELANA